MLNFQNQDCNTSLQEGIEEYRSYLRKNNRYVLGEQVSDSEKWGILCHDATHVIFGLDTTLEEEALKSGLLDKKSFREIVKPENMINPSN